MRHRQKKRVEQNYFCRVVLRLYRSVCKYRWIARVSGRRQMAAKIWWCLGPLAHFTRLYHKKKSHLPTHQWRPSPAQFEARPSALDAP